MILNTSSSFLVLSQVVLVCLVVIGVVRAENVGSSSSSGSRLRREGNIIINDILSDETHQPHFPSIVENVTVSYGRKAVLKCEVENLRNYKVAWVRVDTQTILTIHNNVITRNPRISLSRPGENKWYLHLNSVQESDRGWYMCQINTDPMVHRSGYVQVVVPPAIVNTGQAHDMVVREGDNITLSCDANGYPPPHIVWRREDGDDILLGGKKMNIVEGPKLRLEKISRLNMGDYLCVASNGIPPSASNRFSIRVQFPPMFWIPSQREAVYVGQESVTIECHSEAFPKSINYWVNSKGAMLQSNDKHEIVTVDTGYKVYMKLHIKNIKRSDIAEYRCVAKNSLGHSDGSISLYQIDAPTKPTTTTSTTTTVVYRSFEEETTQDWRRRKGHHRKRLRESRRHSYTLDKEQENVGDGDGNKRVRIIHRPNEDKVGAAESNEGEDNSKDEHVNNQSTGKSFWASGSMSLCSSSSIVSLFLLTTGLMLIF